MAKKHQSHIAHSWQTFDPNRLVLGPSKMSALSVMDRGCEIADTLQVPIDTMVLDVKWAKHNGNLYCPGLVVCLKVLNDMPVFYKIQRVVVNDEKLLLITFSLQTLCLDEHLYAYKVVCTTDGSHVIFVKDLFCYKAFDVQMSYSDNDSSSFIVPYCFLWKKEITNILNWGNGYFLFYFLPIQISFILMCNCPVLISKIVILCILFFCFIQMLLHFIQNILQWMLNVNGGQNIIHELFMNSCHCYPCMCCIVLQ